MLRDQQGLEKDQYGWRIKSSKVVGSSTSKVAAK